MTFKADHDTISGGSRAVSIIAVALFGLLLAWPLAVVIANHWTLTGYYEEGIGYRYFYNLRQLYDPSTYLFLPQGQFTDLLQKGIHLALTAIGYPPEQLRPRIDLFAFASLAVFHSMTVAAFFWLIKSSRTATAAIINVFYWVIPSYVLASGLTLLQPDYPAIELAFAIFAAGYVARINAPFNWTTNHAFLMGVFLGIAASTKVTLVVFPLTVIGWALVASPGISGVLYVRLAAISGAAFWTAIMTIALSGRRSFMRQYFGELAWFLYARGGTPTPSETPNWPIWMLDRFLAEPSVIKFIYITPIFAILGLMGATRSTLKLTIILFIGAIASNLVLALRDYGITQIEAGLYLFLVIWVCTAKIWWPAVGARVPHRATQIVTVAFGVALLIVTFTLIENPGSILAGIGRNTEEQRDLRQVQADYPGRHLWLVPNNFYRPNSVDSAIMKGGSNSYGQWLIPPSPLMRRAFPNVDFAFHEVDLSNKKIENYNAVFFVYLQDLNSMIALLRDTHHMNFADWTCRHAMRLANTGVAVCVPPSSAIKPAPVSD